MKKLISFSNSVKKQAICASTTILSAFALFFAAAPCLGRLHEPEVPQKLQ